MFFALLDALKDGVDIEYDNLFVAWRYGAVIPEDYHYYKKYGCLSILDSGEYFEDFSFLDKYILNYADNNTHSLAIESMKSILWTKNKENILNGHYPKYSLEDLKADAIKQL